MADLAMWVALIVGKICLCLCILKKHFFGRLPWFSAYVFGSTLKSSLLFGIAFLGSYASYYYTFYVTGHLESALAFVTLIECGRQVLPGFNLPGKEKAGLWLLTAASAVIVFVVAFPFHFIENRLEVGAYLSIAVAFIFIGAYSRYLGLYWSRLLATVTATLGLLYLVEGVTRAVSWHFASSLVLLARQISPITNLLAVAAWTVAILSPWGERKLTEQDLSKYQQIVDGVETNLRNFAMEGRKAG